MRDLPILFSGAIVNALLDGRKTQTRRVIAKQPADGWTFDTTPRFGRITSPHPKKGRFGAFIRHGVGTDFSQFDLIPSLYGMPGDRLWVRETWQGPMCDEGTLDADTDHSAKYCEYRADGGPTPEYVDFEDNVHRGWKPSIFLPRWASRITLAVTGMRIERLQEISEADARAEGAIYGPLLPMGFNWAGCDPDDAMMRSRFAVLWQGINAARGFGWDANPWVWVVQFKRVGGEA